MIEALNYLKKHPLLTAVIAVALGFFPVKLLPTSSYVGRCLLRIVLCGTMMVCLYLISGEKTFLRSDGKVGYAFRSLMGFLIFGLVVGGGGAIINLKGGVKDGVLLRLLTHIPMYLSGCMFEELCFRAVLNDAIVYRFRSSRGVFIISAVVTALTFGVVHVMGGPLTSALEWAQAALKTLSAAATAIAFLIVYWKTRNVWAVGLVHGCFDILTDLSGIIGVDTKVGLGSYVLSGDMGFYAVVIYLVQTAIGVLITLYVWKKVGRTIDFQAMRESW